MSQSKKEDHVANLSQNEHQILQDWYIKRKKNLMVTYISECLYMFEYSAILISALYYYKDTIKVENPKLYYSLTLGAAYLLTPFSSVIVGKYTDRTRNIRKVALILSFFNIVGNLFYVFPLFNWLPIFGRMLCGVPDGVRPAFLGDLSRTYSKSDTVKHLGYIMIFGLIFRSIGPVSSILFQWVDFKLFGMEINQYNAIGLFMVFITIIYQIIAYFFLTNLTKEPGYQIFLRIHGREDQNSNVEDSKPTEKLLTYKEIFTNLDIDIILLGVLVAAFMYTQFEVSINITAITKFSWSIEYFGVVTIIAISISLILMKVLTRLSSQVDINFLFTIIFVIFSTVINLLSLPLAFKIQNRSLEVCFLLTCSVLYLVAAYNVRVHSSSLLFMIVPMHSRCFIIGVRQVISKIGVAAGFFSASFLFTFGSIAYPVLAMLCLTVAIIRLLRSPRFLEKYLML